MRVITWNINSVRLRINSVKRAVKKLDPDVLCLQETKCLKEDFPFLEVYLHTSEIRGKEDYFADEFEIGGEDTHIDTTNKSIQETLNEILSIHR